MKRKSTLTVRTITAEEIKDALEDSSGDLDEAAYALDISVKTLNRLRTKFQIKIRDYK